MPRLQRRGAHLALGHAVNFDLLLRAEHCLEEVNLKVEFVVLAGRGARRAAAHATAHACSAEKQREAAPFQFSCQLLRYLVCRRRRRCGPQNGKQQQKERVTIG